MLTVLTWYWVQRGGRTKYRPWHVNLWASMVRRHLTMPHRIACVTDEPAGIDPSIEIIDPPRDFEEVRIPTWGDHMPQCLRRLAMYRPDAADIFGERFVSMDLDCVVGGPLDPLFSREEDIVLYRSPSPGRAKRPYNGSMVLMSAGARPDVYTQFTPAGAEAAGRRYIGSDQAWISQVLGEGEATFGPEHGVTWWKSRANGALKTLMFFPGDPKPWDVLGDPWVGEHYRGDIGGRALVLGAAPSLWGDVRLALEAGPYDRVIAVPDVAAKYPGPIDAVEPSIDAAVACARRMGCADIVRCGDREVTL